MKKLFTLFAALCCTLFSVMAAGTFSDGTYARISFVDMTESGKNPVTPENCPNLKAGSITYDEATHTLTLNNVTLEGTHSAADLYINAGTGDFDYTIKLVGTNKITSSARGLHAYWHSASHKYIITGDRSASLEVETSSTSLGAIVSASDNGGGKYWNLEINGGCTVKAKSAGIYAIMCNDLTLNRVNLTVETPASPKMDIAGSYSGYDEEIIEDNSERTVYVTPSEWYPVTIKGIQLNDRRLLLDQTNYSTELSSGNLSYDPETRTLTLNDVTIKEDGTEPAIIINDEEDKTTPITILLKGYNTANHRVIFQTPVIISGIGADNHLYVFGKTNNGIDVQNASLVIKDGVRLYVQSQTNYPFIGNGSTLTIDHAVVTIDGSSSLNNRCPLSGFTAVNLIGCAITPPAGKVYVYDATDKRLEDGDGNEVKQTTVWVEQNEYIFSALADPSAAGTISLKKDGAAISNPYLHEDADVEITATAAANEGWTFDSWSNGESGKETTYIIHDYNEELRANFLRNIKSTGAWYYNSSMDFYSTEDFGGTSSPVNNGNVFNSPVQAMTYYNGKLYYAAEYSAGISRVYSEDFDNLGVSAPVVVDETPGYGPFYTICYSYADSYFYTVAYDIGSSKVQLIRIESDGTGYNLVGEISNESSTIHTIASAVSIEGKLYILRASGGVAPAMLYELDPSTLAETLIGSTGVIADPGDYSTHTMVFDYATDELLWLTPNGYLYLVDTKTGLADLAKKTNITDCNAFFQQLAEHSVSLKVKEGQEELGNVKLPNNFKFGWFPEGAKVTLNAIPSEGCKFVKWSDNNTDNPRIITIGNQNIELEAEFAWADGVTAYPIRIGGKQIHSQRLVMSTYNNSQITTGTASYDPEANELTLIGLTMSANSGTLIEVGEESKSTTLKINVGGTSTLTGTLTGTPLRLVKANVKVTGETKLTLTAAGAGIVLSKGSTLTFEGANAEVKGLSYGIRSSESADNDKVIVRGSTLTLDGGVTASFDVYSVAWNYCTTTPANAYFDATSKRITAGEGGAELTKVVFDPQPTLRGEAVQEGTGTFQMKLRDGSGETFTNIGWFASGAEVNITAKPASGFAFGRWMDDPKWGDESQKEDWLRATREMTKTAGNEIMQALFYKQSSSNVVWYGISDGKFVQFKSRDYGANVIESTTDASGITAGDFNGSQYYIAEGGEIKRFSFSSVTKDKDQANYDKATKVADYSGTIYDMAWNFKDNRLYAIMDNDGKLYKLNTSTDPGTLDEVGSFKTGELKTPVTARALAIDASGKKYILSSTSMLYVVIQENTKDKEVLLEPVGDHGGAINAIVSNAPQSLTFDHVSGELYWGAADYLRIIDTKTANSYIAGDLRQTKGVQGVVKGLHRRDRKVTVTVEVAEACKDMGTAIIGTEGETAEQSMIQGTSVTISAIPAEGYQFAYWVQKVDEDAEAPEQIKENPYSFSASSITYVAYFEATQGIENINVEGNEGVQKLLIDGHLYIIRDNRIYNVQGVRVK